MLVARPFQNFEILCLSPSSALPGRTCPIWRRAEAPYLDWRHAVRAVYRISLQRGTPLTHTHSYGCYQVTWSTRYSGFSLLLPFIEILSFIFPHWFFTHFLICLQFCGYWCRIIIFGDDQSNHRFPTVPCVWLSNETETIFLYEDREHHFGGSLCPPIGYVNATRPCRYD